MRILEYTDINAQQHISYWHFLVCFNASYIFEAGGVEIDETYLPVDHA